MNRCIFCQYSCDRSDVLRKHYQRHHPTPESVCDEAKTPRIAVKHPTNPNVAIPLDADGKQLKLGYCWSCWHVIDNTAGQISMKQGGMAGFIDRNHNCKEKQVRPKRGAKVKPAAAPAPATAPVLTVAELPSQPASNDNPYKAVILELLEDKQCAPIIRVEMPDEPDSDEEEEDDVEPLSSKDILRAVILTVPRAMAAVHKEKAKTLPLEKALSAAREELDIYREQCQSLEAENEAIQKDAEERILRIRMYEAQRTEDALQAMAAKKDAAILALVAKLAEATGMSEEDILHNL
jgi:hypothetical protein